MPSIPPPVLTSLGYLLLKAGAQFHQLTDQTLSDLGLTGRHFLVLTFLAEDDVLSQAELGRRLGIDPTIVVGLLDELEGRRLLDRRRDPADRRRHLLELTSDGRKVQRRASEAMSSAEQEFLAPLPARERETVRKALLAVMRRRLAWLAD